MQKRENLNQWNRRNFIRSTAMAGGLVLSSSAIGKAAPADAEELNIAIIGIGAQGQQLINTCMKMTGVRIQAICDIWENYNLKQGSRILTGFQQEHKTYVDYQDMLAGEKDLHAVLIATPDFCHAEQTVACLQAGLPVYCESMMANRLDDARKMAQAAKETGKPLQIGFQRRSHPKYQYCLDHIVNETKLLGEITALNGQWNRPVQTDRGYPRRSPLDEAVLNKYGYRSMQQFRNWQWYRDLGGGPIAELGSHQIDIFNWFMNTPPKSVYAGGGTEFYDTETHEWDDTVMTICEYETGKRTIRAFYQTINNNSNFGHYENLMGDQGTLYLSEASGRVKVYREPSSPDWEKWVKIGILQAPEEKQEQKKEGVITIEESVAPPSYNMPVTFTDPVFQPHLENFFHAVRGKEKLNCPAEVAYATAVTVFKIQESIQSGMKIELKAEDFQV